MYFWYWYRLAAMMLVTPFSCPSTTFCWSAVGSSAQGMADGLAPVDALRERDGEGTRDIVETIAAAGRHYHLAVNLPNVGQIGNLPAGAIVETPAVITGAGISPVAVGDMPEGIAELLRRELAVVRLAVDAVVQGDRQLALQCLLLDPVVTDLDVAQQILDDYLDCYRDYLPQFWR